MRGSTGERLIGASAAGATAGALLLGFWPWEVTVYSRRVEWCGSPFLAVEGSSCSDQLNLFRIVAGAVVAVGTLGLVTFALLMLSHRREAEFVRAARWRARGYVPESEIDLPPPGWRKVHDGGVDEAPEKVLTT